MKVRTILAIMALLAMSGAFADERDSTNSVAWDSLSEQQQQVLSPFVVDWGGMRADRQQRLARGADRWLGMSPEARDGAHPRPARHATDWGRPFVPAPRDRRGNGPRHSR